MPWSNSVSLKRRYLEQQLELGGPDVVLPSADDTQVAVPLAADETVEVDRPAPPDEAPVRRAVPAGAERDWRVDAPAIPGPGHAVELPAASLLDDGPATLDSLEAVAAMVGSCTRCALAQGRTHAVPGEGHPEARLLLIGEGPGAKEDATGRPFVGAAGELLNSILKAIHIPRESVFIANIVKCRPPQNRKPLPDEVAACLPYLQRQVALIRPKVIMALGGTAAESLLGLRKSLGQLRNQVHSYGGIPVVVTYHPAALLRNPNWKKPTWDDVRIARQLLDR